MKKITAKSVVNSRWEIANYIWALMDEEITEEEAILGIEYILQEKKT